MQLGEVDLRKAAAVCADAIRTSHRSTTLVAMKVTCFFPERDVGCGGVAETQVPPRTGLA
jgi:hypothetical protein